MKTLQKFQCEVCHTEYAKKEDAVACEKNHKKPVSFGQCKHQPKSMNSTGYPVAVTVIMDDGKEITYKR